MLGSKNVWAKKILGKNFGSEKYVWSIRCVWSKKFFGLKIIFDPKNFWTEQISTPKTICLKIFWVQILFRLKKWAQGWGMIIRGGWVCV